MGLCHEFGTQIRDGCGHPMHANPHSCSCPECDAVCKGLFEGCPDVWERGPQAVTIAATRASLTKETPAKASASKSSGEVKDSKAPVTTGETETAFAPDKRTDLSLAPPAQSNGGTLIGNGTVVSWDTAVDGGIGDLQLSSPAPISRSRGPRASTTPSTTSPAPSTDAPRSDVLEWFGEAFESLRQELHSLAVGMTQQEAMVAELLDTRQGELRLVLVAEALPDLVSDAVRQAMADHLAGISEAFDGAVATMRQELKRNKKATDASVDALRESVNKALGQVGESIGAHTAELRESEAARARAVKAAVTRQVAPLVAATEESQAANVASLGLLGRKLDRLSAALEKGRPIVASGAPPAPGKTTTRKPKATKGAATKPSAATKPAATKPAATKPAATKPAATKGGARRRAVAEPAAKADLPISVEDPSLGDDEE